MDTDKITTTYDELERLGACKEGLATLLEWCKKHPENNGSYKQLRLTPADILESNGLSHLWWAIEAIESWRVAWDGWRKVNLHGVVAWAKEVSKKPEPNIGLINAQINSSYTKECRAEGEIRHKTLTVFGYPLCCEWPEGMRVEITVRPKREPRRLKAEQILVPENVGTKWRKGGAVAEVQRHQIDCSSVGFWRVDEARWCNAFNNVIIGEWEEVLE